LRHGPWLIVVAAATLGLLAGAALRYVYIDPPEDTTDRAPVADTEAELSGPSPQEVMGEPRPTFALPDLDGDERSIASFEGKVVLLNFWATWCPPCVEEMPVLDRLAREYGDQGLRVVGVALDDASAVRDFAETHDIDYPLLIGGREAYSLVRAYGNARTTLPHTVIIDRDGVVRRVHQGALEASEATELVRPFL